MSISSKIQSLITAANSVTGESRTDLTAAVQDLKDGYGQGGGGTIKMEMTKIASNNAYIGKDNYGSIRFYYDYYSSSLSTYYCDFGKSISPAIVRAIKTASSNRFRIGFFSSYPATGAEAVAGDVTGDGTTGAGTTKTLYVSANNCRYMFVTVSNESTSVSAPDVYYASLEIPTT